MHAQITPTPESSRMLLVFRERYFPEENWRDAINYFLAGMWGGKRKRSAQACPELRLGRVSLQSGRPYGLPGYTMCGLDNEETPPEFLISQTLVVSCGKESEVEVGLARFVKDDDIRELTVDHGEDYLDLGQIQIWKKNRRGAYGVFTKWIPEEFPE